MYPAYFDETYVLWCFVQFQIDTHVPTKRSLRNHKMFQLWPVRMGQHIFWIFLDNFEGPLWNPSRANQLCSCRIHWFNPYHWLFCYIIHISPYPISMISSILVISTICEGYMKISDSRRYFPGQSWWKASLMNLPARTRLAHQSDH